MLTRLLDMSTNLPVSNDALYSSFFHSSLSFSSSFLGVPHIWKTPSLTRPDRKPHACSLPSVSNKQLNSLLSKGLPKTAVDRPINVEGCSAATNLRAQRGSTFASGGAGTRTKPPPAAATKDNREGEASCRRKPRCRRQKPPGGVSVENIVIDREGVGVTGLSLAELSPPFFGKPVTTKGGGDACSAFYSRDHDERWKENVAERPGSRGGVPQGKRNASLPTVRLWFHGCPFSY